MIKITDSEATSLQEFIEFALYDYIRNDVDIDSLLWLYNILNIYKKCGGLNQFCDYDPDETS